MSLGGGVGGGGCFHPLASPNHLEGAIGSPNVGLLARNMSLCKLPGLLRVAAHAVERTHLSSGVSPPGPQFQAGLPD